MGAPGRAASSGATLTRYMRWLESERGLRFDDYQALWRWSTEDLEAFWGSIWDFFDVRADAPYERVLARPLDAGCGVVPRRPAQLRRARLRGQGRRRTSRSSHASELRDERRGDLGRAARAGRGARRRAARARRRAGRPRRRLPAEHPRDGRRLPRLREPRRGVVELLAGLRRAQRGRPLRPDRAEGPAGRRRLRLRRQALRPPRRRRAARRPRCRRSSAPWCSPYLDGAPRPRRPARRDDLGRAARVRRRRRARVRAGRRSTTRCGCSTRRARRACPRRSSRARAGSSWSTSRSSTCTSTRRRATGCSGSPRPGWMMWNFLVSGLLTAGHDPALRRQPRLPEHGRAVGLRRRHRHDVLRHERELHRGAA